MKRFLKKHPWAVGFTACLTAFTVFLALDTFVLSSAYQTDATQINTEMIRLAEEKKPQDSEETGDTASAAGEGNKAAPAAKTTSGEESARTDSTRTDTTVQSGTEAGEKTDSAADAVTGASEKKEMAEGKPKKPGSSEEQSASSESGAGSGTDTDTENDLTADASGRAESSSHKHRKRPGGGSPGRNGTSGFRNSEHDPSVNSSDSSGSTARTKEGGRSAGSGSSSFNEEEAAAEAAAVTTDNTSGGSTYQDDHVTIQYTEYTTNGTTVHVADIQMDSIESLKTAFAQDTYGKNVTQSTSEMAAAHNAILAINGDYYGVQESGYVIRNGVVYRDKAGSNEVLCIYGDGSMQVVDPSTVTAQELVDQGVWQAFSFGPGLIKNGEISVSLNSEVGKAKASNPRTAIGMIDDLHYVFVVSDGRSEESEGLSLYELAAFMEQLGVKTAYNLDGGGSSTMVLQGEVINNPAGGFGDSERKVSDIIYIG